VYERLQKERYINPVTIFTFLPFTVMFGRRQVTFHAIFILKMSVIVANIFTIFYSRCRSLAYHVVNIDSLKTAVWAQCLIDGQVESRSH